MKQSRRRGKLSNPQLHRQLSETGSSLREDMKRGLGSPHRKQSVLLLKLFPLQPLHSQSCGCFGSAGGFGAAHLKQSMRLEKLLLLHLTHSQSSLKTSFLSDPRSNLHLLHLFRLTSFSRVQFLQVHCALSLLLASLVASLERDLDRDLEPERRGERDRDLPGIS